MHVRRMPVRPVGSMGIVAKYVCAVVLTAMPLAASAGAADGDTAWPPTSKGNQDAVDGRKVELFAHGAREGWGYGATGSPSALPEGSASFYVVHPKNPGKDLPLVVVLHSANLSARVYLDFGILKKDGWGYGSGPGDVENSAYVPDGFYGLFLNSSNGEWWGEKALAKSGKELTPTEKRVFDTLEWMAAQYQVDRNRIYLSGGSMGGCGGLAIGGARGDIFAAIKVFVPARVAFMAHRMGFGDAAGMKLPDPPVIVDLSAPNDHWSGDHGVLLRAARKHRIPLILGWGPFGHSGWPSAIGKHPGCATVLAFPWLAIRKNEAYPVFTDASTDHRAPWGGKPDETDGAGQINGYFRWKNVEDTASTLAMKVWLDGPAVTNAPPAMPKESVTDIAFRRLQKFKAASGQTVVWAMARDGKTVASGTIQPDDTGLLTIRKATVTAVPAGIRLTVGAEAK